MLSSKSISPNKHSQCQSSIEYNINNKSVSMEVGYARNNFFYRLNSFKIRYLLN